MIEVVLENHFKGRLNSSDKRKNSGLVHAIDRDVWKMGGVSNGF